jgi:GT2 family glycosyltransferase
MNPAMIIPTTGLDPGLLARLRDSIDHPFDVRVMNNRYENQGVAASWNRAPDFFKAHKWWLIVNDDCWFEPGGLAQICHSADLMCESCHVIQTNEAWPCFVWTAKGCREVGNFDENFWPAYYEDTDYIVRLKLAGWKVGTVPGITVHHGKPYHGGQNYNAMKDGCGLFNRAYFIKKWGSLDPKPTSDPGWHLDPKRRKQMEPIWDTFINMPGAAINM